MSSSELIEKLKVSLEAATYSFDGRQTMRAAIAEYEAALSQQEAEPVEFVKVERFTSDGTQAIVHGVPVYGLDIGDKLYIHPPKPAALSQPVASEIAEVLIPFERGNLFHTASKEGGK